MNFARALLLPALALVLLAWSAPTLAQWAWRDASGRMVYSDLPPPSSVPAKDIVRRPAAIVPRSVDIPAESASDKAPSAAPQATPPRAPSTADRELEAKLKKQQLADAQKKAADDDARQAKIAENCERLRAYQRALDGRFRIARVNADGQQVIMDDATRAAESERTRGEIEQQCQ